MSERREAFEKKRKTETKLSVGENSINKKVDQLMRLIAAFTGRVLKREEQDNEKFANISRDLTAMSYQIQAIAEMCKLNMSEVYVMSTRIQMQDFDKQSAEADAIEGVSPCEGPAKEGDVVIVSLHFAIDGQKTTLVPKARFEIGDKNATHDEVNKSLVGMCVGEKKSAIVVLDGGKQQEINIELIGLRRKPE